MTLTNDEETTTEFDFISQCFFEIIDRLRAEQWLKARDLVTGIKGVGLHQAIDAMSRANHDKIDEHGRENWKQYHYQMSNWFQERIIKAIDDKRFYSVYGWNDFLGTNLDNIIGSVEAAVEIWQSELYRTSQLV